jgi:branched-chain amino acid transport system substrate-binding protein
VATSAGLASCSEEPVADEVIKIGVFEPLSGANSGGGDDEYQGIRLANKHFPKVLGRRVRLAVVDNKSSKHEAARVAALLAQQEVSAVIGSWGSALSMVGAPIFADAGIPAVAATATNPALTRNNDYYFRICFLDSFQGTVSARYAFETLKARSAAIIREAPSNYSVSMTRYFTNEFIRLTGNPGAIVFTASYNTGDRDFTAQLAHIKYLNPDVIFAPGHYTESALLIKQARALGITARFIGGDTWDTNAFLALGGLAVEDVIMSSFFATDVPINPTSEAFLKSFRDEYRAEPSAIAALGYDAYLVILDAIRRANSSDPENIRDALAKTKDFEGAAGYITINAERGADKSVVFKTIKDGQFVFLKTVNPQ